MEYNYYYTHTYQYEVRVSESESKIIKKKERVAGLSAKFIIIIIFDYVCEYMQSHISIESKRLQERELKERKAITILKLKYV